MAAESDSDRAAFLDTDDFGEAVTIGGQSVEGIFDDEYLGSDIGEAIVSSSEPRFVCRTSDLPAITYDSTTLVRGATTYVIVEPQDDGTGMTTLILRLNS